MTAALVSLAAVALLIISVESARENEERGRAMVGFANAMVAGAAASLAGAPYVDCFKVLECAGALAAAVAVRIVFDGRTCPKAFRIFHTKIGAKA